MASADALNDRQQQEFRAQFYDKGQKISKAIFLEAPLPKKIPKFFKPLKWVKSDQKPHTLY